MLDYDFEVARRKETNGIIRDNFMLPLSVDNFIGDDIQTGIDSYARIFLADDNIYAMFLDYNGGQTLGDVGYRMRRMGIVAKKFLPPLADFQYFDRQAVAHYRKNYPSKSKLDKGSLTFYRTYALYSPGLVRIAAVPQGINRYMGESSNWCKALDFSYRKIEVLGL